MSDKVRENRARRAAARQGLALEKSRRRDPRALSYERYRLLDVATNSVAYGADGPEGYALELNDVEVYLGLADGTARP